MKQHSMSRLATFALLSAAILTLASCKSEKSSNAPDPTVEQSQSASIEKGVPGGVKVDTYKVTANVTAIDKAQRTVTLATADGTSETVTCGPEIVNFDQIKVGDQLKVIVTQEVAVSMATQPTTSSAES